MGVSDSNPIGIDDKDDWYIRLTIPKNQRDRFEALMLASNTKDKKEFMQTKVLNEFLAYYSKRDEDGDLWFPKEIVRFLYEKLDREQREILATKIADLTDCKFKESNRKRNFNTLFAYLKRYFYHSQVNCVYRDRIKELQISHPLGSAFSEITGMAISKTLEKFGQKNNLLEYEINNETLMQKVKIQIF